MALSPEANEFLVSIGQDPAWYTPMDPTAYYSAINLNSTQSQQLSLVTGNVGLVAFFFDPVANQGGLGYSIPFFDAIVWPAQKSGRIPWGSATQSYLDAYNAWRTWQFAVYNAWTGNNATISQIQAIAATPATIAEAGSIPAAISDPSRLAKIGEAAAVIVGGLVSAGLLSGNTDPAVGDASSPTGGSPTTQLPGQGDFQPTVLTGIETPDRSLDGAAGVAGTKMNALAAWLKKIGVPIAAIPAIVGLTLFVALPIAVVYGIWWAFKKLV